MDKTLPRQYPRIPVALNIHCEGSSRPLVFVSKNLSRGGILLESPQIFPLGARLTLDFKLPYTHSEMRLPGKVVRHEVESTTGIINGMAIEFVDLKDSDVATIDQYIQSTRQNVP